MMVPCSAAKHHSITRLCFSAVQLDQRPDGDAVQDVLLDITGGRSVPRVFVNGAPATSVVGCV